MNGYEILDLLDEAQLILETIENDVQELSQKDYKKVTGLYPKTLPEYDKIVQGFRSWRKSLEKAFDEEDEY